MICLSNIAMLHFTYKKAGLKPPDFIYRHIEKLWRLVKSCTFPDGRLCRIGGDTRIRYCYCQDYAIPVWLLIKDLFGDRDCEEFEKGLAWYCQQGDECSIKMVLFFLPDAVIF